jgi:hypothetical protein
VGFRQVCTAQHGEDEVSNESSTDPTSFDLYLVNNAVYPPVDKKIATDVDTSDGSYTVDSISGLADG